MPWTRSRHGDRPLVNLTAQVREAMQPDIPSVGPQNPVTEALDRLLESPSREVIVLDADRRVAGIITESDILQRAGKTVTAGGPQGSGGMAEGWPDRPRAGARGRGKVAEQVMSHPVVTVREDAAVGDALRDHDRAQDQAAARRGHGGAARGDSQPVFPARCPGENGRDRNTR